MAAAADSANGGILAAFDAYQATREDNAPHRTGATTAVPAGLRQIDEEDEDERAIEATLSPRLQPNPPSGVDNRNV
jgi:hypothetical protein